MFSGTSRGVYAVGRANSHWEVRPVRRKADPASALSDLPDKFLETLGIRQHRSPSHPAYGVPTHSSDPSANTWCFQIGTRAFSRSISARFGVERLPAVRGDARDDDGGLADREPAGAVDRREGEDVELGGHLVGDGAHLGGRCRVGRVVKVGDLAAPVVVADGADEQVQTTAASCSSAATTSATSRALLARSIRRTRIVTRPA
jgi:hypothetical protein